MKISTTPLYSLIVILAHCVDHSLEADSASHSDKSSSLEISDDFSSDPSSLENECSIDMTEVQSFTSDDDDDESPDDVSWSPLEALKQCTNDYDSMVVTAHRINELCKQKKDVKALVESLRNDSIRLTTFRKYHGRYLLQVGIPRPLDCFLELCLATRLSWLAAVTAYRPLDPETLKSSTHDLHDFSSKACWSRA